MKITRRIYIQRDYEACQRCEEHPADVTLTLKQVPVPEAPNPVEPVEERRMLCLGCLHIVRRALVKRVRHQPA